MEENFKNIKIEEKSLDTRDQEVVNKLNSLEIKFNNFVNSDNKLIYTFSDVKRLDHNAFLLDANNKKIIYLSLHFDFKEGKFEELRSGREITPDKLTKYLSEKFPEADNIILSCCAPERARDLLREMSDKIIFIGTGVGTYSTWYYDKESKLSSVKNC